MRKSTFARLQQFRFSLFNASVVFFIQVSTLARSPQNPDGAEMVSVVEQGKGVLHTPGYPLQSWLNQIVGAIPIGTIALRLSVFSLACQTLTIFLLSEVLRKLSVHPVAAAIGLSFYAFFPSNWTSSVQPEKYALTGLTMAFLIWLTLRIVESKPALSSRRNQILLGVAIGLGFAQHLIFLLVMPFVSLPALLSKKKPRERIVQLLLPAVISMIVAGVFYLSLLLRSHGAIWPDWGKLSSLSDLVRHVLRRDFPVGKLSPMGGPMPYGAFAIFFADYCHSFIVMGFLPVFGLFTVFLEKKNARNRAFLYCTVGFLVLSILFLIASRIHPPEALAYTYLERYSLPAMMALAIFAAWGMNWLIARALSRVNPKVIYAFILLAVVFPAMLIVDEWPRVDFSYDQTLDIYREVLGVGVDDSAFFIQGSDLDVLYGAKIGNRIRYPLFGDYPWAIERADYLIEPRLKQIQKEPAGINGMSQAAFRAGFTVISANQNVIQAASNNVEIRGIHWVAGPDVHHAVSARTLQAALDICKILKRLNYTIPKSGHYYTRMIFETFRYPFYSAARYLEEKGKKDQHELALKVAFGLYRGEDPQTWIEGCQAFLKANAN